jgi:hypothetical protein
MCGSRLYQIEHNTGPIMFAAMAALENPDAKLNMVRNDSRLAAEFAPCTRVVAISPRSVRMDVTTQLIELDKIDAEALVEQALIKRFVAV